MAHDQNFTLEDFYKNDPLIPNIVRAGHRLGATISKIMPTSFDDGVLAQVCSTKHKCMLGIGELETVLDPKLAVDRAKKAGVTVYTYPNTGHLMYYQQPSRNQIAQDVLEFLQNGRKEEAISPAHEDEF